MGVDASTSGPRPFPAPTCANASIIPRCGCRTAALAVSRQPSRPPTSTPESPNTTSRTTEARAPQPQERTLTHGTRLSLTEILLPTNKNLRILRKNTGGQMMSMVCPCGEVLLLTRDTGQPTTSTGPHPSTESTGKRAKRSQLRESLLAKPSTKRLPRSRPSPPTVPLLSPEQRRLRLSMIALPEPITSPPWSLPCPTAETTHRPGNGPSLLLTQSTTGIT